MSAEPKLAPVAPAPAPPAKPTLVPAPQTPRSHTGVWIVLTILAVGMAAFLLYRSRAQSSQAASAPGFRTLKVASGAASPLLRVTGSTSARVYASINAPVMMGPDSGRGLLLQSVAKSGSMVKAGDVVAQLDTQAIQDHADDVAALVQQADDTIKRRRADQSIEIENLRQSILSAKAVWDKAKLDYSARDIRTDIDREILKLNVDEAEASYNNLVLALALTQKKFVSQMVLLQSQKEQQVRHHTRHVRDVQNFTIHAPINGLVVLNTIFRGGDFAQVQEGDQLSPGQPFAKVVDIRTMELDGSVNQSESQTVRIGQTARVHLDAFPQLEFAGKILQHRRAGRFRRVQRLLGPQSASENRHRRLRSATDSGSFGQRRPAARHTQDGHAGTTRSLGNLVARYHGRSTRGHRLEGSSSRRGVRTNTTAIITSGLHPGDEIAVAHP